jgi:hypothetical protein
MDQWAVDVIDACEKIGMLLKDNFLEEVQEICTLRPTLVLLIHLGRQAGALAVLKATGLVPDEEGVCCYQKFANAGGQVCNLRSIVQPQSFSRSSVLFSRA